MANRGQYDSPRVNKSGAFKGGVGGTKPSPPRKTSAIRGGREPGENPKENKTGAFKGGVGGATQTPARKPYDRRAQALAASDNNKDKVDTTTSGPGRPAPSSNKTSSSSSGSNRTAPAPPGSLNFFMQKTGGRKNAAYTLYKRYKQAQRRGVVSKQSPFPKAGVKPGNDRSD